MASYTDHTATTSTPQDDGPTQALVRELAETENRDERQQLCTRIIESTIPVADRLAARYRGRGIPLEDLRQVARAALVQAMRRFHGTGEQSFLAYAIPCMRGELRRYFRDSGWVVRPPRRVQEARTAMSRAREDLHQALGHEPTLEEVANATDLPIETVREASGASHCFQPDSLDQPLGDSGSDASLGDSVGTTDAGYREAEARALVRPLLDRLGDRDRRLITLRFFNGMTQSEVGERIGISQMQVSRVESRILRDFRESLAA